MNQICVLAAAVGLTMPFIAQAARWDGGRLLVEEGADKKLTVASNLEWLKAGKVPAESVGNERTPTAEGVAAARAAFAKADRRKGATAGTPSPRGWVENGLETLELGVEILEARVNGMTNEEFDDYAKRFRKTWLFDNREGGLEESLKLQRKELK